MTVHSTNEIDLIDWPMKEIGIFFNFSGRF